MKSTQILGNRLLLFLFVLFSVLLYYTFPRASMLGLIFFESYEFEKAFNYLTQAQELEPSNIYVYKKLKDYMLYKGQVQKALELQKKLTELRPNNLEYHSELEKLYGWVGDDYSKLKESEKILLMDHQLNPKEKSKRYSEIAEGLRWLRKYDDAKRIYNKIIESGDLEILQKAQQFFGAISDIDSAKIIFNKYQKIKDISPDSVMSMGETLFFTKRYEESIPYFIWPYLERRWDRPIYPFTFLSNAITLNKNKRYALQMIFLALKKNGKNTLAYQFYENILTTYPHWDQVRMELIYEYVKSHDSKIEKHLNFFMSTNSPRTYQLDIVNILNDAKRFQEALKLLLIIETKDPSNEIMLKQIAEIYELLGQKELSLKYYTKLLKLKEESVSIIYNILYAKNDISKTDAPFSRQIKKKTDPNDIIWLRLKVADLSEELKKTDLSMEQLEKLHKENPVDIGILEKIAERYLWYNKKFEAYNIFEQILKIRPDHNKAQFYLGIWYFEKESFDLAYQQLLMVNDQEIINSILFQSYFEETIFLTKHKDEHKKICKDWIEKKSKSNLKDIENDLIFRCLYREEMKEDALSWIEKTTGFKKDHEKISQAIDISLEIRNLPKAKQYLKDLKKSDQFNEYNNAQEYYLDELIWHDNQQLSWKITQYNKLTELNNFSLFKSGLEISKNINSLLKYGLDSSYKKSLSLISIRYSVFSPFVKYVGQKNYAQIHYSFASGDRKFLSPAFHFEFQHYVDSHLSLGADYNNSDIEDLTKELFSLSDLDKRSALVHASYGNRKIHSYFSSQYNYLKTPRSSGVNTIQYLEASYDLRKIYLSPGIKASYQNFNSTQNELSSYYIEKSFPQYIFVKSNLKKRFAQEFNFTSEAYFSLGQDTVRNINFGKLINPGASIEILYKHIFNLKASFDYYNFSLLGASGHYQLAQLSIGAVF